MNAIFTNSKNSKTFDPQRLLFKLDLNKMFLYRILAYTIHGKI